MTDSNVVKFGHSDDESLEHDPSKYDRYLPIMNVESEEARKLISTSICEIGDHLLDGHVEMPECEDCQKALLGYEVIVALMYAIDEKDWQAAADALVYARELHTRLLVEEDDVE